MKQSQTKRSTLFLMELMISILFFCLCSAVCVRLFVKSHTVSQDTYNLNMALNQITSMQECFRSGEEMHSSSLYYDKNWSSCKKEDASFVIQIQIQSDGAGWDGMFTAKELATGKDIHSSSLYTYTGEAME